MQDKDEARDIIHGLIHFVEHMQDNAVNGMEQAVQELSVFQKERPEAFINRENAVSVADIDQLKGHVCSSFHSVFIAAGRAETAFAAERHKFKFPAVWTGIHSAAIGRIAAVDHLINVFHFTVTGM